VAKAVLTSNIYYSNQLPDLEIQSDDILVFDQNLSTLYSEFIAQFPNKYPIIAGEVCKEFSVANALITWTVQQAKTSRPRFISFGGGSVSDLVGFVASIYKRGSPYICIPTTWLSAIDSAHGGKTALNVAGIKNVIGTFYQPQSIYISKIILQSLPKELEQDSWSELIKIGLIDSELLFQELLADDVEIWEILPKAIEAKYRIVRLDPYEQNGTRRLLNLGHTLGHVIESATGLSHGKSIAYGLQFALYLSQKYGYLKKPLHIPRLPNLEELKALLRNIPNAYELLNQDKKNVGSDCYFVFVQKPGAVVTAKIPIAQIYDEIKQLCESK
jgi:3-dehydroquinate synthetase